MTQYKKRINKGLRKNGFAHKVGGLCAKPEKILVCFYVNGEQ